MRDELVAISYGSKRTHSSPTLSPPTHPLSRFVRKLQPTSLPSHTHFIPTLFHFQTPAACTPSLGSAA